jgi:hypothetical protein
MGVITTTAVNSSANHQLMKDTGRKSTSVEGGHYAFFAYVKVK